MPEPVAWLVAGAVSVYAVLATVSVVRQRRRLSDLLTVLVEEVEDRADLTWEVALLRRAVFARREDDPV